MVTEQEGEGIACWVKFREPQRRRDIFERFYTLPEGLIERFYVARSTRSDKLRILCGKPPVAVGHAMAALTSSGAPLAREEAA